MYSVHKILSEGNKDTHEHLRRSIPAEYGQNTRPELPNDCNREQVNLTTHRQIGKEADN